MSSAILHPYSLFLLLSYGERHELIPIPEKSTDMSVGRSERGRTQGRRRTWSVCGGGWREWAAFLGASILWILKLGCA